MVLGPYHQRVIEVVGRSMSFFQHIGVPGETFNLRWEARQVP